MRRFIICSTIMAMIITGMFGPVGLWLAIITVMGAIDIYITYKVASGIAVAVRQFFS